ncbi:MAG: ADP-ribosylglycohydrolase family protein [Planctomycetes bacterium]|nr:ADP-ribosylglycohydrolase family protein [Planctomycetota bacterium]
MHRNMLVLFIVLAISVLSLSSCSVIEKCEWFQAKCDTQEVRRLPVSEYIDKVKAGWVGQMAGVGWGGPTEFKYCEEIIPENKMPKWYPEMINQFGQDDIYVEMTFLRTLELYGFDVSIEQAGIDFANSGYQLWHANLAARDNLRKGIAPPDSSHPNFSSHSDDIDYQIEADFSGLIAPAMPNLVIALGEKFGRLMNYGDGLYAGQFVGAMYAEAFFENDIEKIIHVGLKAIPKDSQYYECVTDVLQWYKQYPDNWQKTWQLIDSKYQKNPDYRRFACDGPTNKCNIDVKINGAYIVMGMLYGNRDLDKTIIIATRGGHDSDCNPANAAGILFTTIGFNNLPERFTSAIDPEGKFSHTPYNFPMLIKVCEKLARQAVERTGGYIEKDKDGAEVFVIPVKKPKLAKLQQSYKPGPIANSKFTSEEMEKIHVFPAMSIEDALEKFAPGWTVLNCGDSLEPGLHAELRGKKNVFVTHPAMDKTDCVLTKDVSIPAGKKTILKLTLGHHEVGDWELIVKADGKKLFGKIISEKSVDKDGWLDVNVDIGQFAGKKIKLELVNHANDWNHESAYWAEIKIDSK